MEPVSAATAAVAREATVAALIEGGEVAVEAREALLGESGLVEQLDTIQHRSLESLAARNEAAIREVSQIEINRLKGLDREKAVFEELRKEYPKEDGYDMESQCILRNKGGEIVRDPISGESRRLDFVVIKDGQVVKSAEVTSETADKAAQLAKEDRIRDAGGDFVMNRVSGELVPFAPGVRTETMRRA